MGIIADNAKRPVETEIDLAMTSIWLNTFNNVRWKLTKWVGTPEITACEDAIEALQARHRNGEAINLDEFTQACVNWGFAVVKAQGGYKYEPAVTEKEVNNPVDEPAEQRGQSDIFTGSLSNYTGTRRSRGESSNKR